MFSTTKGRWLIGVLVTLAVIALATFAASKGIGDPQTKDAPAAKQPAGPSPSRIYESRPRTVPPLVAPGRDIRASVLEFIDFAGQSGTDQREGVRDALAAGQKNNDVAGVLCEEAQKAQRTDHSRALLVLSLLGELRNPQGAQCLERFLAQPFPQSGTKVDGEIVEQTALGELQAKAVDGLAYLNNKAADEAVLKAVHSHPSIIVRAEAIVAYLWNHRDNDAEARRTLGQYVRKGEEIYLDRVTRDSGESAESFNRKLDAFLAKHPETAAPKPERETKPPGTKQRDTNPTYAKPPNW